MLSRSLTKQEQIDLAEAEAAAEPEEEHPAWAVWAGRILMLVVIILIIKFVILKKGDDGDEVIDADVAGAEY